uniref:Uncharacterized protein n=1 Tax=Arundo donax TaxID=35708 RepID=A0A0A9AQE1_ARUDO
MCLRGAVPTPHVCLPRKSWTTPPRLSPWAACRHRRPSSPGASSVPDQAEGT